MKNGDLRCIEFTKRDEELFRPLRELLESEYGYADSRSRRYQDGTEPWCKILVIRDQVQQELGRSMGYDHEAMSEAIRRYEDQERLRLRMDGAEEYEYLIASAEVMEGLK